MTIKYLKIISFGSLIFLSLLVFTYEKAAFSQSGPGLANRVTNSVNKILNRYQGYSFNRVISLGDSAKFRDAIYAAKIKINKAALTEKKLFGRAIPPNTLELQMDPKFLKAKQEETFNITVWHETIHLLEFKNNDTEGDKFWNERHAEYLEGVAKNVLDPLRDFEDDARRPGISDETLKGHWNQIKRHFKNGPGHNQKYPHPPDPALLEKWTGCRVKMSEIENLYRSGAAGSRLKRIIDAVEIVDISIKDAIVTPLVRKVTDTEFRFKVDIKFTILTDSPTQKWAGSVNWFGRLELYDKKNRERKFFNDGSGKITGCTQGYQEASFIFRVPDVVAEKQYEFFIRIDVQGLSDKIYKSIVIKYPQVDFKIRGPRTVSESDDCTAKVTITDGVAPFWWEWSCGKARRSGPP